MSSLRFCLFGRVRVAHADKPQAELKLTPSSQLLLAYLLLNRHRAISRGVLADVFWGEYDDERARHCLSTSLWRLRRALKKGSISLAYVLETTAAGEIGFNPNANYWLDVAAFEDWSKQGLRKPVDQMSANEVRLLEQACHLYVGDLMEGVYYDWALHERERLRIVYLSCLRQLMRYYGLDGDYENSLAYGRTILELDPLREQTHRDLMRLHAANGHRALALQQFEECCQILASELEIAPMAETQALYREIKRNGSYIAVTKPAEDLQPSLKQTKQQLDQALRGLSRAQEQINRALHIMANLLEQPKPRESDGEQAN